MKIIMNKNFMSKITKKKGAHLISIKFYLNAYPELYSFFEF